MISNNRIVRIKVQIVQISSGRKYIKHYKLNKEGKEENVVFPTNKETREKFENVNVFIDELKRYIDYYNYERISMKLKGMSPVQYRTHSLTI